MHDRMMDKSVQPSDKAIINWIKQPLAVEWTALRKFLTKTYHVDPTFNSGGKKYGWNLQYRISGRPLCEMYPEQGSFTVLVILGKVELEHAMERIESFGSLAKRALSESPRFHDGCWMYMRVSDPLTCHQDVLDIQELILIKRKPAKKKTKSEKSAD